MTQRFTIPGRLSGLNEYTLANRRNRYAGSKLKCLDQATVTGAIYAAGLCPVARPVRLKYLWIEPNAKRDKDNIAAAQKVVQDALVEVGILPGDGWRHVIGFDHDFAVDKQNPRIEIQIVEVET